MINFLYGSDSYRQRKKINEIVGQYGQKHLTCEKFELDSSRANQSNDEFLRLKEFARNRSIFEKEKLAIVAGLFEFADENKKKTIEFLKANLHDKDFTIVIFEGKNPNKNFAFLLEPPVLFHEFANLEGEKLKFFIKKEAEKRGLKLAVDAIGFLARIFNNDSWGLINELDKLSLFDLASFDASRLKNLIDDFRPLAMDQFFSQLYALSGSRSLKQKIVGLEVLLNSEEPAKIFNILAASSRNQPAEIKRFADYDVAVKSGKIDYEEALLDLCLFS
ncbi:MAG: hypothetical protein AAB496_01220 [Patescibacteria group bacterium]